MRTFAAVVRRDLRTGFRRGGDIASPIVFFILVSVLFPLALSSERELLQTIGPAVVWIAALLATMLSLNALFRTDVDDGSMEQLAVGPHSLVVVMLAKTCAHWLQAGLPLVVLAPLMAITYHLPPAGVAALVITLLLGTPTLSLLGSIGAALTAGVRQSGGLLAILVLPLMLPVLIFGARATALAAVGESIAGPVYLLAAFAILALTLVPFASAAAMRISLD